MSAYVIVEIDVRDPENYERYKELAPPSISQYGGRYLVRGGKVDLLEGEWNPKRLVILEFESVERAKQWWASEEYRNAKTLRQASATTKMIVLPAYQPE